MEELDANGDGEIDFQEFMTMMSHQETLGDSDGVSLVCRKRMVWGGRVSWARLTWRPLVWRGRSDLGRAGHCHNSAIGREKA